MWTCKRRKTIGYVWHGKKEETLSTRNNNNNPRQSLSLKIEVPWRGDENDLFMFICPIYCVVGTTILNKNHKKSSLLPIKKVLNDHLFFVQLFNHPFMEKETLSCKWYTYKTFTGIKGSFTNIFFNHHIQFDCSKYLNLLCYFIVQYCMHITISNSSNPINTYSNHITYP